MIKNWDETLQCLIVVAGTITAIGLIGHYASSCEKARDERKARTQLECLRAGKTVVECKLLEIAR